MKSGKLYIDIETLPPLQWAEHERTTYVAAKVPGQYKKPESIAAWCQENYDEQWSRAALDWRVSRIACIGVMWEPDDHDTLYSGCFIGGTTDEAEYRMFTELADFLREHKAWAADIVGHNVLGFDLPRLHITAARLRHVLAGWVQEASSEHRKRVTDTMYLAFPSRERVSLSDLACALGVGDKSGHGSEVLPLWLAGKHGEISDYCLHDVSLTRKIYLSLVGAPYDARS
jgi:predicted PolB exonuclease-like 3'-5' exonuclease